MFADDFVFTIRAFQLGWDNLLKGMHSFNNLFASVINLEKFEALWISNSEMEGWVKNIPIKWYTLG